MAKINREEYEILKGLDNEWKWVARDKNGSLFAYLEKPLKDPYSRDWGFTGDEWFLIKEILFEFIQWEDEEPHNIQELIEEYEKYKKASDYFKVNIKNVNQSMLDVLPTESEETEVKNIEWLKGRFRGRKLFKPQNDKEIGYNMAIDEFSEYVDQLDEPKTLTPEWIDDHTFGDWNEYVYTEDLQNLLVPKQEVTEEHGMSESEWAEVINRYKWHLKQEGYVVIEKPTIPQFVAEHIKIRKGETLAQAYNISTHTKVGKWLLDKENCETFAKALLCGFIVQKEHKYYARIKGWQNVTTGSEAFNWVYFKEKDTVGISKAVENKYQAVSFTKYDWNNLGINEDNADFILVEELE